MRAAARAALPGLSHRHLDRAFCRQGTRAAGTARDARCRAPLRARLLHRVRSTRRQRERDRFAGARLFGYARHYCGPRDHCHGPALPRAYADQNVDARKAPRHDQAGRIVGRLFDGAGVCARLDAVHRPDPRRDSCGCRIRGNRGERRRPARDLFTRPRHTVHRGRTCDRAVRRFPGALSRSSWSGGEGHGRVVGAHRHRLSHRRGDAG